MSPLALVNDGEKRVRLVIDAELAGEEAFLFHPLENNASVSLSRSSLNTFLRSIEHSADWLPLAERKSDRLTTVVNLHRGTRLKIATRLK
ncbi:hypothetical protein [Burkholderia diffusa]|uniref:hypothetical protein n=1 Tax=Burkholderia diffusa TaxID=488732 RepID=UPI000A43F25F|nr:hypothetical protein [Burkholderia diffusa]